MTIYLVRNIDNSSVDSIYCDKVKANNRCNKLGNHYDVTVFDTEDEPDE